MLLWGHRSDFLFDLGLGGASLRHGPGETRNHLNRYHSPMNFHEAYNAIKRRDVILVRSSLDGGLDPNLSNQFGCTLLMAAAMGGNTAIAAELIRYGASLDARDTHRWTALSTAAHTGHPGFVEALSKAGASLDGYPFGASFEDFLT